MVIIHMTSPKLLIDIHVCLKPRTFSKQITSLLKRAYLIQASFNKIVQHVDIQMFYFKTTN